MSNPAKGPLEVNQERLWASIMEMGEIGAIAGGGCRRPALSDVDGQARNLFVDWCREAGCEISIDSVGNIYARRTGLEPERPAIATGSHLDTQLHGGRFDGIFGVLAGLEVVRSLNDHNQQTLHPIDIVVWTNEEASRFLPPLTGSSAYSGKIAPEDVHAIETFDGTLVKQDLEQIGYLGALTPSEREFAAFLEAHIEQGPVLENEGLQVGVVTQIQAIRFVSVMVKGEEGHAGTVPLSDRHDALLGAAEMVAALRYLAEEVGDDMRLTVGRFEVSPNSGSTIPGQVDFLIDLRHPSDAVLKEVAARLGPTLTQIATHRNLDLELTTRMEVESVRFDTTLIETLRRAADRLNLPFKNIPSGAGHDAMNLAKVVPTAMLFVPCERGISHSVAENAKPEDLAAGTNVLLEAIRDIDARLEKNDVYSSTSFL